MTETAATIAAVPDERQTRARDIRLVSLVSAAHLLSHFYQLVLPPIFPLLTAQFGVGYTELGLVMALTYTVSGLMQTPAGMLVDRLGSARVLVGGVGLYSTAVLLYGLIPSFWWLLPLAILAGFGNCVFHPADYAIMSAKVHPTRVGRAFGIHTLAGNIGWAAAPFTVLSLTALGGWRTALVILGTAGLALTAYLASQAALLRPEPRPAQQAPAHTARPAAASLLLSRAILVCFGYFLLLSISQVGLQTFLPSTAVASFGLSIEAANFMLTVFLLAASVGTLAGGVAADRLPRHTLVVAVGLAAAAAASLALAILPMPPLLLTASAGVAGFGMGATTPARDMLVRGATPAGATGKVFGFVYSGLDLGSAISPPILGLLLDHHHPRLVFVVAAAALFIAIATAFVVGNEAAPARPQARRDAAVAAE